MAPTSSPLLVLALRATGVSLWTPASLLHPGCLARPSAGMSWLPGQCLLFSAVPSLTAHQLHLSVFLSSSSQEQEPYLTVSSLPMGCDARAEVVSLYPVAVAGAGQPGICVAA